MKTKEEILKLSYKYSDKVNMSKDMTSLSIADAVTYGYNQCQEDNKDKKYTEENIKQAIIYGMNTKQIDWGMVDEFIKSLNKQD